VQARIRDGLTSDRYLFARATTPTYDNAIARACRNAGKVAKLSYGQAHGFTCHSFRHTAITHWMEVTGVAYVYQNMRPLGSVKERSLANYESKRLTLASKNAMA